MDLENHYNKLWNQSLQKFRRDKFEFDPLINSNDDIRYGITLLAQPSKEVKRTISTTLKEIRPVVEISELTVPPISLKLCHLFRS